ncbi:putative Phenylalanine--tRNA ligase beta subunit [Paratrimastix pyriformis]|uniref:phenylalanine--tRNA ligase n=1 Tax=Paratrimastix pyriformis TaxID=342808 RepID=A0ABQ8UT16_9EUKA|nr:putative Phenylalanine--tRNA ligase beta subunit [Paratrimastix pyriformis]
MPVIEINKRAFLKALNRPEDLSHEAIEELCGQFGIEVDKFLDEEGTMKLEIAANRYDLCGFDGVVRAFRVFLGLEPAPTFTAAPARHHITVEPAVNKVRPYVVSAILRGMTFTDELYQAFIGLQEKLHENACRRRALVAIGTHDLDLIQAPFFYRARAPATIEFEPLHTGDLVIGKTSADKILAAYADPKNNSHLRPFVPLIGGSEVYPVICDSTPDGLGVLSLPPIINSERSKIRPRKVDAEGHVLDEGSHNVFVECTGTDLTRANIVLNTLITNFYPYCAGGVEKVEIRYEGQPPMVCPQLDTWTLTTTADYMRRAIGVEMTTADVVGFLNRMQYQAATDPAQPDRIVVRVPPTRSDVMHECDLMEDVAVAYGFKRIAQQACVPALQTVGGVLPDREMTELLRQEAAGCGFTEVATFALVSQDENFAFLQRPDDHSACVIENPKTRDFEVCRTNLLPCLLRTVSEVVLKDSAMDTGARNELRMCALHCAATPGFEVVHGLLDYTLNRFGVTCGEPAPAPADAPKRPTVRKTYRLVPSADQAFIEGQRADVILVRTTTRPEGPATVEEDRLGVIGVLHPRVLTRFEISEPCAAFELQVAKLYEVPFTTV